MTRILRAPRRQPLIATEIETAMTRAELERLAGVCRNRVVLELGSYMGASTVTIASVANRLHAVDPHGPDISSLGHATTLLPLMDNLERFRLRDRVIVHVAASEDVLPVLQPGLFDVVFIDAKHDADSVEKDLGLSLRVVRSGGAIAFHDYGLEGIEWEGRWHPFGVTEVVDRFVFSSAAASLDVVDHLAVVRLR